MSKGLDFQGIVAERDPIRINGIVGSANLVKMKRSKSVLETTQSATQTIEQERLIQGFALLSIQNVEDLCKVVHGASAGILAASKGEWMMSPFTSKVPTVLAESCRP